jgi:hypothetical protein
MDEKALQKLIKKCVGESLDGLVEGYREKISDYLGPGLWVDQVVQELEGCLEKVRTNLEKLLENEILTLLKNEGREKE